MGSKLVADKFLDINTLGILGLGLEADLHNLLLMHAMGSNVAGLMISLVAAP